MEKPHIALQIAFWTLILLLCASSHTNVRETVMRILIQLREKMFMLVGANIIWNCLFVLIALSEMTGVTTVHNTLPWFMKWSWIMLLAAGNVGLHYLQLRVLWQHDVTPSADGNILDSPAPGTALAAGGMSLAGGAGGIYQGPTGPTGPQAFTG